MKKTSIETYNKINHSGLLKKLRLEVYNYIYEHGPCSMMQCNQDLNSGKYSNGSYTSRFNELEKRGVIEVVGKQTSPHTGHSENLYDTTDNEPLNLPKVVTKKEQIKKLTEENAKLKLVIRGLIQNVKVIYSNGYVDAGWGGNAYDDAMDAINGWDDNTL